MAFPCLWFRITDDGTNRICHVSGDGQHFITIHSVGRTDFLTADEVFFGVVGTTNFANRTLLLSWKQS